MPTQSSGLTKLRATTPLAADICRVDRQRLNEAIASGHYPCAPETISGRARVFNVLDLLALRIYGQLTREGVTPRYAGHAACQFRQFLDACPDADEGVQVVCDFGSNLCPVHWLSLSSYEPSVTHVSGHPIVSVRIWRLKLLREEIIARLEEEDARHITCPHAHPSIATQDRPPRHIVTGSMTGGAPHPSRGAPGTGPRDGGR